MVSGGEWGVHGGQGNATLFLDFSGSGFFQDFPRFELAFWQVPMSEAVDAQQVAVFVGQQAARCRHVLGVAAQGSPGRFEVPAHPPGVVGFGDAFRHRRQGLATPVCNCGFLVDNCRGFGQGQAPRAPIHIIPSCHVPVFG